MVPLAASELHRISGCLRTCDPKSAIARLGGLLTVPALQANTTRIETLVHLAAAYCHGRRDLRRSEIGHLLNERLGEVSVTSLEDPVEDVFVTSVETPEGNLAEVVEICRRFQGEAEGELDRRIQRVEWTKANPRGLERIVGFAPDPANIDHRLVTNTHVPIMYLTSLPIDASKIEPLSEQEDNGCA